MISTNALQCDRSLCRQRVLVVDNEQTVRNDHVKNLRRWNYAPIVAEGTLEGRITTAPRGREGFGYDPVFEVGQTGRTLAEMPFAEKNRLSHRAAALANLAARLREG